MQIGLKLFHRMPIVVLCSVTTSKEPPMKIITTLILLSFLIDPIYSLCAWALGGYDYHEEVDGQPDRVVFEQHK